MSKYKGPRIRLIRRIGKITSLTTKNSSRETRPGQHGGKRLSKARKEKQKRLLEKQKLRFYYGLTEKQLVSYIKNARASKRSTIEVLFRRLEIRLDNVLFRRGFALTLPHARQIVNHGKVKVDGKLVTVSSYFCFVGQVIEVCSDPEICSIGRITRSLCSSVLQCCRTLRFIPRYLKEVSLREVKVDSRAGRIDFQIKFKELLVIEYYSKRLLLNVLKS